MKNSRQGKTALNTEVFKANLKIFKALGSDLMWPFCR